MISVLLTDGFLFLLRPLLIILISIFDAAVDTDEEYC